MSPKSLPPLSLLLLAAVLLAACSRPKPADLPLDDRAGVLDAGRQAQLRAAQEEYRQKCDGALAVVTVPLIERPEPGGFADEEFRELKWPAWVEDETPRAFILYSRTPELVQVRLNNRWLPLEDRIALRTNVANDNQRLVRDHRPQEAMLASAQALATGCPRPEAQGWVRRQLHDGMEEARATVNDYAYPKPRWYTRWYYTLAFDPLLNGFLMIASLFNFSSWVLILFPLAVVLCVDKKAVELLIKAGALPVVWLISRGAKINPDFFGRHAPSLFSVPLLLLTLAAKGFRQLLGLPSYAVLCIALLARPEDLLTAQNHLYSWMPATALTHLPLHGPLSGTVSPMAAAGWLVGLIYFVASAINQAEAMYKAARMYDTDEEELKAKFGFVGELVKEEGRQADAVLEAWLKQLWKTVLFSVVIAFAPLALSLYFVIKAVADAAWVVVPLAGARLGLKPPLLFRALPQAAMLLILVVGYSQIPKQPAVVMAAEPPPLPTATVVVRAVNVRQKPTPKGRVVSLLKRGERVQVLGEKDGWKEVKLADGGTGYMPANSISAEPAASNRNSNK